MTHSHRNTVAPEGFMRTQGFTLIELMITVLVVSVLTAIAFPIYQHQMRESRRTDARSALLDLASREERYYALNNAYTSTASNLGYSGWGTAYPIGSGYYYLDQPTVAAATATTTATFSLEAQPVAGKGQDLDSSCQTFTVTQTGQDTSTNSGSTDSTPTCWAQ